ncbi:MAG: hypothetical protein ACTSP3_03310 [Candidatus Heimdallarchaeaceae archaeon]
MPNISKKQFYQYVNKLKTEIRELNLKQEIYQDNFPEKKKDSCDNAVLSSILESNLGLEDFQKIKSIIYAGKAIDLDFFFNNNQNSTLWDFIHVELVDFAKALFKETPKGFGTPNAAPGEGELMFCLLHPAIIKPTKGDLCVIQNDTEYIFELKGDQPRVQSNILGIDFLIETLSIAEKYNIKPNKCKARNINFAVEIEKRSYKEHYDKELKKMNYQEKREFLWEWLNATGGVFPNKEKTLDSILLHHEGYNQKELQKEIIKGFFRYMCANEDFNSMILLGNGENIKVIPKEPDVFDKMIDTGLIKIHSDYFRVAQSYRLGWYIS